MFLLIGKTLEKGGNHLEIAGNIVEKAGNSWKKVEIPEKRLKTLEIVNWLKYNSNLQNNGNYFRESL